MEKKFEPIESETKMVSEPSVPYSTVVAPVHFDVTVEDNTMVLTVQKGLQMIKGVASVRLANHGREKVAADPFAELDTSGAGNRDANEIDQIINTL